MVLLQTIILIFSFYIAGKCAPIIKSGDVVEISVLQHPEFSGRYSVNERGYIDYPLLADQPVINISTTELMNDLTFKLARHIDNPLVLVSVVEKPEITVTVLGEVVNPGPVKTVEGASIQEVIKAAGGAVPKRSDLSRVKIFRKEKTGAPELFNLDSFLVQGNVEDMPRLSAEDIVVVPGQVKARKVKVIGSVQKPGLFELEEPMNLFEAIYLAGGPTEKADLSRVRRFTRLENGNAADEVINIQGYIDKGRMDNIPFVMEGDVIIVYSKWFDWKTMLTILNNTLLFIVTIQAFAGIFK